MTLGRTHHRLLRESDASLLQEFQNGLRAGDLLHDLAALAGGKGGGKPDQARGAAPEREKLDKIKAAAAAKF